MQRRNRTIIHSYQVHKISVVTRNGCYQDIKTTCCFIVCASSIIYKFVLFCHTGQYLYFNALSITI